MKYTPTEISRGLSVLAECNGNAAEAARRLHIPRRTLVYWAEKVGVRGSVASGENGKAEQRSGTSAEQDKAAVEWEKAWRMNAAQLSDPEKVKGASLKDNTIAGGVSFDKWRLLTGAATARVEIVGSLEAVLRLAVQPAPALGDGDTIEGEVVPQADSEPA